MKLHYATAEEYDAIIERMAARRKAVADIAKLKKTAKFRAMTLQQRLDALRPLQAIVAAPVLR
jgi:hypothetical protein